MNSRPFGILNHLYLGNPLTSTFINSEDPDEMQYNAAFHQGLHCLLRLKQSSENEIHHKLTLSIKDPLKYESRVCLYEKSIRKKLKLIYESLAQMSK